MITAPIIKQQNLAKHGMLFDVHPNSRNYFKLISDSHLILTPHSSRTLRKTYCKK